MKLIVAALLNFLLSVSYVAAETSQTSKPAQSIAELQQQLEKILNETHTPGVSVAIAGRDGPEWIAGLSRSEKLGRVGTEYELAKPLVAIQWVQVPPD